ncbi:MAG: integrase [Candidatus Atribacteria bacterium]|nr:MAG: integrase [Candidatus Atribacteria bacterium]
MNTRRKKLPAVLELEEAQSLLSIPNKRYVTGIRNKAILALMLNLGLRVSEVVNLKPGDLNLTKRKLRVVNGKGGVDRDLIIPEYTAEILREWKKAKPKNSRYFFTTIKDKSEGKFASSKGSQLSVRYIQFMVKRYAGKAGIDKNITPHTLRHTFATDFIRQGQNVMKLKKILGHSDISTTQIYVTLANKDIEEAMNGFKEFKA